MPQWVMVLGTKFDLDPRIHCRSCSLIFTCYSTHTSVHIHSNYKQISKCLSMSPLVTSGRQYWGQSWQSEQALLVLFPGLGIFLLILKKYIPKATSAHTESQYSPRSQGDCGSYRMRQLITLYLLIRRGCDVKERGRE